MIAQFRPLSNDFGMVELVLITACIIVWLGVMWRSGRVLKKVGEARDYRRLLFLAVIWIPLLGILVRSMYDAYLIGESIAVLVAGIMRFTLLIIGLLLLWLGPPEGDLPK